MSRGCAIAATVLEQLKPLVRPGITTQDLEEAGRDWIAASEPAAPVMATSTVAPLPGAHLHLGE